MKRSRLSRVIGSKSKVRLRGLSAQELKDWFQINDVIEVADVFGVRDMVLRAKLEKKMSPAQAAILEDAISAIEDYNLSPRKAYKTAYERMLELKS
jgi:hypothetical protein